MSGICVAAIKIKAVKTALVTLAVPPAAFVSFRAAFFPVIIVLVYGGEVVAILNWKRIPAVSNWNKKMAARYTSENIWQVNKFLPRIRAIQLSENSLRKKLLLIFQMRTPKIAVKSSCRRE